ncbi:MAG: sulfotransferase [Bacteroidetes bacterium]|nr:sulfotransferase [Bacteroidota bacterium]
MSAARLRRIFPDAKFICIIRDYRDNFISIKKLAEKDVAVEAPVVSLQVARWRYYMCRFLRYKRRYPEKYHIFRYEDLVTEQEQTFRSICDFLGIAYDPAVFDFHKKKDETVNAYGDYIYEKYHENLLKPVNTGRMNTWQNVLTAKEVRLADQIAGKFADSLGYERKNKSFSLLVFIRSCPMVVYNYVVFGLMVLGTYLPYRVSQWWFFNSLILLRIYMKLFGKKSVPGM